MVENKKDVEELKKLLKKCLSPLERPMENELEQAIINKTHQIKGTHRIWRIAEKQNLTLNPYTVWKFCILMHKILHHGHKQSISDGLVYKTNLQQYAQYWQQLGDKSMGQCITCYCHLILRKLNFHEIHKHFLGNLELEYETPLNADRIFQTSLDIFDYLEELLQLQCIIFTNVQCHQLEISSKKGMCRLSALYLIATECYLLYQHSVNNLQILHSTLPPDDISGLCERFNSIVSVLQQFFAQMQYNQLSLANLDMGPLEWSASSFLLNERKELLAEQLPEPSAPCIADFDNDYT